MIYIEIDGTKYPCKIDSFHTQTGNPAVRITDAPLAENGFKIYNNQILVADMSEYTHLYRSEGTIKEYTKAAEEIIPASGYQSGIPESPIQRQLNAINKRISDITPYTESKEAGIQDKECIFDGKYRDGVLTANVLTSRGEQKPCEVERSGDNITVRFEELTDTATVTIQIQ